MTLEIELKFRLTDVSTIAVSLVRLNAKELSQVDHLDRYFNHPSRDFRETDEAFRIRSVGHSNCLTYKGAVIGDVAKTRREIEVSFAEGDKAASEMVEIINLLGFRFVREVRKTRRMLTLDWNGHHYELALDDVPPLGKFLEIELIADESEQEVAEAAVWNLARELSLTIPEPKSYLNLLIELE